MSLKNFFSFKIFNSHCILFNPFFHIYTQNFLNRSFIHDTNVCRCRLFIQLPFCGIFVFAYVIFIFSNILQNNTVLIEFRTKDARTLWRETKNKTPLTDSLKSITFKKCLVEYKSTCKKEYISNKNFITIVVCFITTPYKNFSVQYKHKHSNEYIRWKDMLLLLLYVDMLMVMLMNDAWNKNLYLT